VATVHQHRSNCKDGSATHIVTRDDLGPMVVYLGSQGYTWMKEIIAHVLEHGEAGGLAEAGLIDREDLEPAELALEAGFGEIDHGQPAPLPEHEPFHPGPEDEPHEPTGEDLAEWAEYLAELRLDFDPASLEAMREWYATRPTFEEWLAANGGPA
jgi:hypothetical protein